MNTGPRVVPSGWLAAVPCSVNAAAATCGAAPSPGTGIFALEEARLLDRQLQFARCRFQVGHVLDAAGKLRRLIGDALIGELQRELLLNLRAHLVRAASSMPAACR